MRDGPVVARLFPKGGARLGGVSVCVLQPVLLSQLVRLPIVP